MNGPKRRPGNLFAQQLPLPGINRPGTQRRVLATPAEQAIECARTRLIFISLLFVAAFLVVGVRLTDLALFSDNGDTVSEHKAATAMGRADIVDRNGAILAVSLPTISACAQVAAIKDPEATAAAINKILPDIDRKKLANDFRVRKGCVAVHRHLTPKQYYALNKLGIAGVEFTRDERRAYPQAALTAHVIGTTDIDNIGTAGIEKKLDARLRQDAAPVRLSLDIRVQHILHRELAAAMRDFQAIGAAGLIMDAESGEVVSMVSLPDFDPHEAGEASDDAKFNRATLGVYELGSTFKIFTAAQALDTGEVKLTDTFDATNPIHIGHQTISDFHPEKRPLTVPEIIMLSSNIGAAKMAEKIGGLRQRSFLEQLGMFAPVPVELPETGRPIVPRNWGEVTVMTVGFGHGLAVSPLQLVRAAATITNSGHAITPTLLREESAQKKPKASGVQPIVTTATAAKVRALMRLVVSKGTAKSANIDGYLVGGKTGTAEKIGVHGYDKNARLSSFVGIFPANAPRYVIFAMLDEPKGNKQTYGFSTGGWVAAPLVGRVITAAAPLLGLMPADAENFRVAEQQVLKPLGPRILNELALNDDSEDTASVDATQEN
ncbi:MAG: penicillin-binding protein 2 [Alphaproteobacteria bacterium]